MSPLIREDETSEGDRPCITTTRSQLEGLLLHPSNVVDWNVIGSLLRSLKSEEQRYDCREDAFVSLRDDPMGRLFVTRILSRNPPTALLEMALTVFPDSLSHNPSAFFTACRDASPEIVTYMMQHITRDFDDSRDECPYPWIVSDLIPLEGAKAIIEAFPRGVLKPSSFLSSYCLVDFFLMAPEMVDRRSFDSLLWNKFKLLLVAAGCYEKERPNCPCPGISPVQVILRQTFSFTDFWSIPERARHVIWLLHQLRSTDQWVFEKQYSDGRFPLHHALSHKCTPHGMGLLAGRELIKLLLEAHPSSAKECFSGKLPLHMALENGWPCHDLLLCAYPDALDSRDAGSELLPFQSAAMPSSTSPLSLDVTFELLRANPNHAAALLEESGGLGARAY